MIMIADMWSYPKNWSSWYPKRIWWRKRSGDQLACSSRADGYIIWYISQSRIFCYFDVPRRRSRRSNAIVCTHTHSLLHSIHTHSTNIPTSAYSIHTHKRSDTADLRGSCYSYCATGGSCTTVGTASLKQNTRTLIHTYLRQAIRSSQHILPCKCFYYLHWFFQYPVILKFLIMLP